MCFSPLCLSFWGAMTSILFREFKQKGNCLCVLPALAVFCCMTVGATRLAISMKPHRQQDCGNVENTYTFALLLCIACIEYGSKFTTHNSALFQPFYQPIFPCGTGLLEVCSYYAVIGVIQHSTSTGIVYQMLKPGYQILKPFSWQNYLARVNHAVVTQRLDYYTWENP